MSSESQYTNGSNGAVTGSFAVKAGLAQMLKGGVIMDVVAPEDACIAEEAGACAVMALERVPADIRRDGGVSRMSDPEMIRGIIEAVTIPVMAKVRIGHFVEAQIIQALGVDYIDESEVLTPADEEHHINKHKFTVPFVCGCLELREALRGQGFAFVGDVVGRARESVDCLHRLAQARRQQEGCNGKVFVVFDRHSGCFRARDGAGRAEYTGPPWQVLSSWRSPAGELARRTHDGVFAGRQEKSPHSFRCRGLRKPDAKRDRANATPL